MEPDAAGDYSEVGFRLSYMFLNVETELQKEYYVLRDVPRTLVSRSRFFS